MLVEVYSDGSGTSFGNAGGWAFVVVVDGVKVHEDSGSEANATNNTMELTAALKGLEYVHSQTQYISADVVLISDSQLVLGFATGKWNCKKQHLALLAAKLNTVFKMLHVKDKWVKGHSGDVFYERCDILAGAAREVMKGKP